METISNIFRSLPYSTEAYWALKWYCLHEPNSFHPDDTILKDPQALLNLWKFARQWNLTSLKQYMEVAQAGFWTVRSLDQLRQ